MMRKIVKTMRGKYISVAIAATALTLVVSGCSSHDPFSSQAADSGNVAVPSTWVSSSAPSSSVSPVIVPSAIATPSVTPAPSKAPKVSPSAHSTEQLSLFYVATEDNGASGEVFGCDDSLVLVETENANAINSQIEASFDQLLADHDEHYGQSGLYNALWQSNLTYDRSTISGDTVTVYLTGTVASGGTCDDPRIIMQLKRTATVAVGVGYARILINGKPITQVLSEKG